MVQIIALDTFTSVSYNAEVLMAERLAFAGSLPQISSFTLSLITWLLIFLENFLSLLHRILYIKFPIY